MPWVIRLVAYMPTDNDVHLSIYTSRIDTIEDIDFIRGSTTVLRSQSALSPGSSPAHLINWSIIPNENQAGFYIWGVWQSDVRICVKYLQIDDPVVEREHYHQFSKRPLLNGRWWPVAMQMPLTGFVKSMSHVDDSVKDVSKYYADVIFTSGHFSECTIIRALKTLFQDREYTPNVDLESQVIEALFVRTPPGASLVERERIRHREIIGWTRFISYCAKLDHEASRALGLSIALDTGYMVIIKQDSLSFLTACDDSEILYHTFQDKQFEVTQFIASPPSQLRSTYPRLRDQALRHDIAKVFRAIDHLSHNITNESAKNLENTICQLSLTNGPRNFVEILSQEHLPYYISKADMNRARNLVGACKSPADVFRYLTLQLAHSEDTSSDTNQAGPIPHRRVLPYETLVVTSIQQLASSRYTIAQNVLILLATIFSSPRSYRAWVQDEAQLLSSAMRVTQSLMLLKWISNQALSAPTSTSMELEQQLSKMHVDEANLNNPQVTLRERLTASLLRTMTSKTGKISTVEFPIYFAVPRVVSTFLHVIGIRSQRSETEAMYHAGLAQHLSKLNEMKLLAQFLDIVSTASSLSYYRGRVLLSQAKPTQAIEQFMAVITCFGNGLKEVEQELDIMQLDYSTGVIRGHTKLEEYYDNVIRLLVEHGAHEQAITIAKIALSDILHNSKADVRIRSLLEVIIDSALAIGAYDSAFNAMMLLPQDGLKRSALRKFVKIICDNGDGAKLSLFPFNGLQDQVEQLLKSKAEQNAVLSKPDNYKILYSYYIYRCEYKKAATIMCQYARRLCDGTNRTETVWRLLTEAGSAYLAAINALQAADSSNAWVSIELAGVAIEEPSKRRRLNDSLQNPTSSALLDRRCVSVPCKREILQLTDLKQEFQLIKAKLLLVTEIPDEVIPAALTMSARETQLLLVQRGCYEEATSLALMHDLDLDIVFKLLVDKYLSDLRLEQE
ncbi:nucleoporin Nup120/160-domain-containing protein [Lobosporangium transversale]|uniref:Nucleoporin Nup120/160-domain-containing protein n=1 Tax=Lobosporangium transversale TaxID=64571 RepID=A0A1Y2G7X0_9FUNG|nr:nucleoporin Nup120/160-domain-containing protein [Lobosporangium transversale]ORY95107.1 nucleoporin Nup120/160-domain-containing protein [Lobosporangium transversale]|eukprot:XP_021875316.1 nucleoporin Nup120/160-domain-containing protein [Lobosporangium transversale]